MSMQIKCQETLRQSDNRFWGQIFGLSIKSGREKNAFSVEQAASLAGMEPSEWLAVEAGRVPENAEQLRSMAGALGFSNAQLGTLVLFCKGAWQV